MNKTALVLALVLVVAVGISATIGANVGSKPDLGGTTRAATTIANTLTVTGAATVAGLQVDSGSTITEHGCATETLNPSSFSSSTIASSSVAVAGAALGDVAYASFENASSSDNYHVAARISGTATGTVTFIATPGSTAWNSGIDLVTSTVRICYFSYS